MKNSIILILIIVLLGVGLLLLTKNQTEAPIGGDRDTNGCLTPAGFAYSEDVGACIRAFDMTPDIMNAAKLAVDYVGKSYALTVVSFNSYEEVGAYDIMFEKGVERTPQTVYIKNWKVQTPSGGGGILPYNSGVSGQVLLGPICPVMRDPPEENCADRGYETTVQVIVVGSPNSSPFTTVKTDKDGKFTIMLPPGEYALQPIGGKVFPSCSSVNVSVKPATILEVNLSCDTGIR